MLPSFKIGPLLAVCLMKILILLLFLACDMANIVVDDKEQALHDKLQHAEMFDPVIFLWPL
jgi:hypothetical protein